MWDLVPWSAIEPRPPALGARSLSHWTTTEVQGYSFCDTLITPIHSTSCGSAGEESVCNEGDLGSIPGLGRSPGEGKAYPLQYSGLENSMVCLVHGVANCWTQLSDLHKSHTKSNILPPVFPCDLSVNVLPYNQSSFSSIEACSTLSTPGWGYLLYSKSELIQSWLFKVFLFSKFPKAT